ncbi:LuxR C-terminal-related transcriptional regulator [Labrys portucalensis]|uniref:LuxR C-terminal-related transcriptional regulator n=1 Tax=Labrys neptuniae TaxID=376174 RepID=A0ABV6Z8P3_9HYPH|nr:response regulator transcription factor [Labrys neptuniae]MDT3377710.1 response regulator transcription factor [Labrys neptuniae]
MVVNSPPGQIALINHRTLQRDCISRVLAVEFPERKILPFARLDEWNAVADEHEEVSLVIICEGDDPSDLTLLAAATGHMPSAAIIILSDSEDPASIFRALDLGVKGYIPSTLGAEVAIEATRLVIAGGVFVPAASLIRAATEPALVRQEQPGRNYPRISPRQLSIIAAVSRGKSNAAIATELNLRESTVKVHIRNIMKKLKVKSRTAIAHKSRDILRAEGYELNSASDMQRLTLDIARSS